MAGRRTWRRHDARALPVADDDARDHHGILRPFYSASECVRKLFPAAATRRAANGIPAFIRPVILVHSFFFFSHAGGVRHSGWGAAVGLDSISAVERSGGRI